MSLLVRGSITYRMRNLRILHAPHSIVGNAFMLSRAERALGHKSDTMVFCTPPQGYEADIVLELDKVTRKKAYIISISFFLKALLRYEIFHFNFGGSLFSYLDRLILKDLPLLRKMGKKIVFTFQGCDARSKEYCLQNFATSACHVCDYEYCTPEENRNRRLRIETIAKHAHKIYVLNPDLLHVLPRAEFLPYGSVDLSIWHPPGENMKPEPPPFLVLHAPSSRTLKGTAHVVNAVENLRKMNIPVELLLVENIPHNHAREYYQRAHIAVDQLLGGWYGAFAVEAMALGIPTLCYIRDEDLSYVPFGGQLPIVKTSADTLSADILRLIDNVQLRKEIGIQSRDFVERFHNPVTVARKLIDDYMSLL